MEQKLYQKTWFICLLFAFWFIYGIPLIIGIVLLILKNRSDNELLEANEHMTHKIAELTSANMSMSSQIDSLGITDYNEALKMFEKLKEEKRLETENYREGMRLEIQKIRENVYYETQEVNKQIVANNDTIARLRQEIIELKERKDSLSKSVATHERKLLRCKEIYKSIEYAIDNFLALSVPYGDCRIPQADFDDLEMYAPSVTLKLHCMDVKSLRQAYRDNEKQISKLLDLYSIRYTTKANQSIYSLMIIALKAELQNILYNLKYDKLDDSIDIIKSITAKYLKIAGEGNQTIAGTLTKFIGEMEYLFINAIKIEYNYYVKKEQNRQEQLAIKEQMRQEAEERKALEREKQKVEQEESKFTAQINALTEQAHSAEGAELEALKARILELQAQLAYVTVRREEIVNLQNGKAGNVYIISNLGSFGENIFKIGMTRRLNPQERVDELSSTSVPFRFDVHSFIFSDDAVGLETELHKRLNDKRVNKVNMRKEFFNITLDELETLVDEICPTAEFNKTMLAEEFRQSLSTDELYSSDYVLADDDLDE